MNGVDASSHYEKNNDEPPPSLLAVIIDTNPHAWALLADTLTLSQAIANLLVFINAHLAFNHANQVIVIASHIQRAEFLYPPPSTLSTTAYLNGTSDKQNGGTTSDSEMTDAPSTLPNNSTSRPLAGNHGVSTSNGTTPSLPRSNTAHPTDDANFYRPFAQISSTLFASLTRILRSTSPASLDSTPTTALAGAITLALAYINKATTLLTTTTPSTLSTATLAAPIPLTSRVLILSVSPASANQYIPLMNTIFASQRLAIPIDILSLAPSGSSSSFLQQASDATNGIYLPLTHPHGLLQTLLQAFLPSPPSRALLIPPTQISVDFRAACFCHRRVVDIGFVCSICLSIFCEPPEGAICLTCGTHLRLGDYGKKSVVVKRRKKRKREERNATDVGTPR